MRASAALLSTASLSAICRRTTAPPRQYLGFQHHAFADAVLAGENFLQNRINFVLRNGRQEAQAAQVDGQDWNFALRREARGGKQGAVAAKHDQQVRAAGQILALPRLRGERPETIARFGIAGHLHSMGLQPIDERWNDARDVLAPRARNNSNGFNHFDFIESKAGSTLASDKQFHFDEF